MTQPLSRRDFLKLSAAGLAGFLLAEAGMDSIPAAASPSVSQGRVAYNKITSYDSPSRTGTKVNTYKRDTLLSLSAEVTGGAAGDYNRRWYRIGEAEYVYSGGVQPVQTVLNKAVADLPKSGAVGEVTVPYSDSWWGINRHPFPGPRLYYATTHWIEGLVIDNAGGGLWYKAYDQLYNAYYYVQPEFVRILPPEELAPLSPEVPAEEKYLEVRLDEQRLLAFEGGQLAFACRVSTGKGEFGTPEGWFTTFHTRPTAHMVGGESDAAMYDLSGVPWDTYITENGVALHGTFWHNDFGTPRSHGCINLTPQDAQRIYRWTQPPVPAGTRFLYQPGQGTSVRVIRSASDPFRRSK
jgi:lipoprotein-anchoring transpeptidase ErfK/SrfK